MKVLFLDGYNLMHRARYGFVKGDFNVIFNFFRGIRPIVEKFNPDKVYFVLEGNPQHRFDLLPEYKANRSAGLTPEKEKALEGFRDQKAVIEELIYSFPFEVVLHPNYECDDVIASLIRLDHKDDECIVISNDTDFIQLYNTNNNVTVYSPVKKEYMHPTPYDYVSWKALVGDNSDNIPGVPRVGKKTAAKILQSDKTLQAWKDDNPEKVEIFNRNVKLIRFSDISPEIDQLYREAGKADWGYLKLAFEAFGFESMTKDSTWEKYVETFVKLG